LAGAPFGGRALKLSINFEEILSRVRGNYEEQYKVLKTSVIINNYRIIIIDECYKYIINAHYNYYISNKGLLEECYKEEYVAVTGAATAS
jgi:hypothetical protein